MTVPRRKNVRGMVFDAIKLPGPVSTREIARLTGLPIGTVSGRVSALRKLNEIHDFGFVWDDGTQQLAPAWLAGPEPVDPVAALKQMGVDLPPEQEKRLTAFVNEKVPACLILNFTWPSERTETSS